MLLPGGCADFSKLAGRRRVSTDGHEPGGKDLAQELVAEAKAMYEQAHSDEEQLSLLDPPTAEEMAWAQQELGPHAGRLAVLQHARKGRKRGSRNKRTQDFAKFIQSHGQDPAVVLAEIASTPEEIMVERSRMMDPVKRQMTWGDARAMRIRCAEALMPYVHGKQPVRVDATIRGVVVHEEIGEIRRVGENIIDGEILGVALPSEDGEGEE